MSAYSFATCYARFEQNNLTIGNQYIERVWSLASGLPIPTSITDKTANKEWLAPTKAAGTALEQVGSMEGEPAFDQYNDLGLGDTALRVQVPFTHPHGTMFWTHLVYPEAPFIRSYWLFCPRSPAATRAATPDTSHTDADTTATDPIESDPAPSEAAAAPADALDGFTLAPMHLRWQAVTLRDVTDRHNNLVSTDSGFFYRNEQRFLQGNLLFCTEPLDETGLIVVKESPTPLGHLHYPPGDFHLKGYQLQVNGSGLTPADLAAGEQVQSYGVAIGVAQGGEAGALLALQSYHRALRHIVPERDLFVMSNTWGDRSRDSRVSEQFILQELPIAARLGVTIYQIDDGWQRGRTVNSAVPGGVFEGFHAFDSAFWEVHPERFPRGLAPIVAEARALGIRIGLWFAPDSDNDFAHWESDAAILINLHREHGVTHFKLDGVKIRSKVGEERLVQMMRRVIERTGGAVTFNLDATAGVRLGYYGRSHYGSIFLENRYTDWVNYYPYRTLRNLWMLSRYFPAARLQIEFLNVRRNQDKYGDDPLAPAAVGIAYAFGVATCANPLAWMELSGLSAEDQDVLARAIPAYRAHQQALLSGAVLPIGEEPDGTSWTGFQSIITENTGYLVVYREHNRSPRYRFRLWQLESCRLELEPVFGTGQERRIEVDARGEAYFTMPHPMSMACYRYTRWSALG